MFLQNGLYIGELKGKGANNDFFLCFEPPILYLCCYFGILPQRGVAKDFLRQFWKIKNVVT